MMEPFEEPLDKGPNSTCIDQKRKSKDVNIGRRIKSRENKSRRKI